MPRDQVWLTSKVRQETGRAKWRSPFVLINPAYMQLWNSFHAPEDVEAALDISLQALGTEYLDLYLIHW